MPSVALTIIGLGPGDPGLLTLEARDHLAAAQEIWLRTARHPTVTALPSGPRYESFDEIYEREPTFDAVYEEIVERVIELARRPEGVVYAVPGHPLFGEATVRALVFRAADEGLVFRIVPGVSFVDTVSVALGIDPLTDGLLIVDALTLSSRRQTLTPQRPTIVAQVYDQRAASQAKLTLLDIYPPEHPIRIVRAGGGDGDRIVETTLRSLDHDPDAFDHLASLYLPALDPFDDVRSFAGLRSVVSQLRAPEGGCPWDLEQTHQTLKHFLLEEAYEALDALDAGEPHRIAEELGDLLMQVVLHAQVAEDAGDFAMEDVIASIATKLVRRHPHVFGDVTVAGADEVLRNWETLKSEERGDAPVLAAVPKAMPALAQAQSVQSRATKAGLAGSVSTDGAAHRLRTAAGALSSLDEHALGDLLFAIVTLARANNIDAEESLRIAVRRFRDDVGAREAVRRATSTERAG